MSASSNFQHATIYFLGKTSGIADSLEECFEVDDLQAVLSSGLNAHIYIYTKLVSVQHTLTKPSQYSTKSGEERISTKAGPCMVFCSMWRTLLFD